MASLSEKVAQLDAKLGNSDLAKYPKTLAAFMDRCENQFKSLITRACASDEANNELHKKTVELTACTEAIE